MNIDPFTIPCAFCQSTLFLQDVSTDDEELICCESCATIVSPNIFISGGINALAGKLARRGIHIEDMSYGKSPSWAWASDKGSKMGTSFKTFEEAVLDSWETLKGKENENAY